MIVVGIENDEIALFANFDTSNTVGSLKGGGSVQGQGGDGFFDAHLHIMQAKAMVSGMEPEKQLPGFRSVASATAQPASIISRPRA